MYLINGNQARPGHRALPSCPLEDPWEEKRCETREARGILGKRRSWPGLGSLGIACYGSSLGVGMQVSTAGPERNGGWQLEIETVN